MTYDICILLLRYCIHMLLTVHTIIWSNNFFLLRGHVQPVGRPCGTWMHYAMRDEGRERHGTANGLPQPRMELAERSHEQTYLG